MLGHSPLRAAARRSPDVATGTVARHLRIDVHDDHGQRRQQQRQRLRVTEGTSMAPWNRPNNKYGTIKSGGKCKFVKVSFQCSTECKMEGDGG